MLPIIKVSPGALLIPVWRRFYVTIANKFMLALLLSTAWTSLSLWLSLPWLHDLGQLVGMPLAILIITFIAYIPGFMNAFLICTIALDHRPRRELPSHYPGVTLMVACYNEAANIGDTVHGIALQNYAGMFEVLILDDGSTDQTVAVAQHAISEVTGSTRATFRVIPSDCNRGKAATLNRGLSFATHDHIVTIDGDSVLTPTALQRIVERRISDPPETRAVAGAVLVRNQRESWITSIQQWDYFHGIAAVKRMQSMYQGTLVAQGAFSLYDREVLEDVGGWPECVGEDIVLSWAILKAGYRIGYAEDAVVFTKVPATLRLFSQQRKRWSRGLMEAFRHHGMLLLKPRLTTLFIWWNVLFVPLDLVYTFAFIPGIVLALFGHYYIVGIMTLAVLPLTVIWNLVIYRVQSRMLHRQGLQLRGSAAGFLGYTLAYSILMQPVCVWGYFAEFFGLRKQWGTK